MAFSTYVDSIENALFRSFGDIADHHRLLAS